MSTLDLLGRLRAIGSCPGKFSLCAQIDRCWLGRSPEGRASLLIPCAAPHAMLGRAFGALLLRINSAVAFDVDGRTWSSTSAIVECLDEDLLPTFVALAVDVATAIGPGAGLPRADDVVRALASWELLLRSRSALSEEQQVGLWGELRFILDSPSVDGAVRAWSPGRNDVLDFVHGGVAVELKSGGVRFRHSLSHHQAQAQGIDIAVLLGSLWVLPDASGLSLTDMVNAVSSATTEVVSLERKLLSCGFARSQASMYSRRFTLAAPLALFHFDDVPKIHGFDPGVSSIRYVVELDPVRAAPDDEANAALVRLCGISE